MDKQGQRQVAEKSTTQKPKKYNYPLRNKKAVPNTIIIKAETIPLHRYCTNFAWFADKLFIVEIDTCLLRVEISDFQLIPPENSLERSVSFNQTPSFYSADLMTT